MQDSSEARHVCFGVFELDIRSGELRKAGTRLNLPEQSLQILIALLERPAELVTRDELRHRLWPADTFVDFDHGLNAAVNRLRDVIGDSAENPKFVETLPRRGYRFVAAVTYGVGTETETHADGTRPSATAVSVSNSGGQPSSVAPKSTALNWFADRHLALAALTAGVLITAVVLWTFRVPPQRIQRVVALTSLPGYEVSPSFSPDGSEVVFSHYLRSPQRSDNTDIYVGMIGTSEVRRLTTDPLRDIRPNWSPNGSRIAFLRWDGETPAHIHLMSPLGGADTRLSDFPARGPLAWSSDSRYIVAGRWDDTSHGLFAISVPSGIPRAITQQNPPAADRAPAFSPDGHHLAFARCTDLSGYATCNVNVLELDGDLVPTSAPRLVQRTLMSISTLTWAPDGKSIVYDMNTSLAPRYLWRVKADGRGGLPERIELAGASAADPATSQLAHRLAFSRFVEDLDVYKFSDRGTSEAVVQSSVADIEPQYSPDGSHITFASGRSGEVVEIWRAKADGSEPVQLTHTGSVLQGSPHWSSDGSRIAFHSKSEDGLWHIWTVEADGGAVRQITTGMNSQVGPTWSHDGEWLYFSTEERGKPYVSNLWRVGLRGGAPTRVTDTGSGLSGFEVNSGQGVVYQASDSNASLLLIRLDDGDRQVRKLVDCVLVRAFTAQGTAVYYVPCQDGPDPTLRELDLITGRDRALGPLKGFVPGPISASIRDHSVLYTVRSAERADVMIIDDFR